jgi:hypothetical protein
MSNDGTQEQLDGMFSSMEAGMQEILDRETVAEESGDETARGEAIEELYEFGYGMDRKTLVTFTLAGGGPSAWLDCVCVSDDRHGGLELESVTFYATWYGNTPTERRLQESDALYQWAERMVESMEA